MDCKEVETVRKFVRKIEIKDYIIVVGIAVL